MGEPVHQEYGDEARAVLVSALRDKADLLLDYRRNEEALDVYDEVIARFDGSEDAWLEENVAYAISQRADCLSRLGRFDEALAGFGEYLARRNEGWSWDHLGWALAQRAFLLLQLGRPEEALHSFDEIIDLLREESTSAARRRVKWAFTEKCLTLVELGRPGEAQDAFRAFVDYVLESPGNDSVRDAIARGAISIASASVSLGVAALGTRLRLARRRRVNRPQRPRRFRI